MATAAAHRTADHPHAHSGNPHADRWTLTGISPCACTCTRGGRARR